MKGFGTPRGVMLAIRMLCLYIRWVWQDARAKQAYTHIAWVVNSFEILRPVEM
jgi:hypothetical protein